MKVQSTGLGKTVMVARFNGLFNTLYDDRKVMQMTMEAIEPLHWTIKVYLEPKDIRRAVALGLRPSVIWRALLALIFGRFSLFSKTKLDRGEPSPLSAPQPNVSPESSGPSNSDDDTNPLARLKG